MIFRKDTHPMGSLSFFKHYGSSSRSVRCALLVVCALTGAALQLFSPGAFAQAGQGERVENSLDLGWRNRVTLPPGKWEVLTKTTTTGQTGNPWDAWLLRSSDDNAAIPFLTVHAYRSGTRWNRLDCADRPGVGSHFLSNDHGATYPGTDRCSRSWVLSNFKLSGPAPRCRLHQHIACLGASGPHVVHL